MCQFFFVIMKTSMPDAVILPAVLILWALFAEWFRILVDNVFFIAMRCTYLHIIVLCIILPQQNERSYLAESSLHHDNAMFIYAIWLHVLVLFSLTDSSIYWLDRSIDHWLPCTIAFLIACSIACSIDCLLDRLFDRLLDCLLDRLLDRSLDC